MVVRRLPLLLASDISSLVFREHKSLAEPTNPGKSFDVLERDSSRYREGGLDPCTPGLLVCVPLKVMSLQERPTERCDTFHCHHYVIASGLLGSRTEVCEAEEDLVVANLPLL